MEYSIEVTYSVERVKCMYIYVYLKKIILISCLDFKIIFIFGAKTTITIYQELEQKAEIFGSRMNVPWCQMTIKVAYPKNLRADK